MTIGERIRGRRQELNMTQDELAKKAGYKSRSSINKIELSRNLPLRKIAKVAAALDITPSELCGWEETSEEVRMDHVIETNNTTTNIEYDSAEVKEALKFYEQYKKSIPQVQSAVDALLKSTQSDS